MSLIKRSTTRNVGTADRIVRVIPAIAVLYFWSTGVLSGTALIIAAVLAVMLLFTAIVSRCSIYAMLGVSTCTIKES